MSETPVSLLDQLRQRPDGRAWERLVALYTPLLHGWLRRHCLQSSDVDDVVQEVLSVVVRELPQFKHDHRPGAFRHWLKTVLANRLRAFWRARRFRPQATGDSDFLQMLDQLEDPHSGVSQLWDREHDAHILRCLLELAEKEFSPSIWQAFRRTTLECQRACEVAGSLDMTVNAVLIAKSRVLRYLRRESRGLTD